MDTIPRIFMDATFGYDFTYQIFIRSPKVIQESIDYSLRTLSDRRLIDIRSAFDNISNTNIFYKCMIVLDKFNLSSKEISSIDSFHDYITDLEDISEKNIIVILRIPQNVEEIIISDLIVSAAIINMVNRSKKFVLFFET